jgi:hypothetical protein
MAMAQVLDYTPAAMRRSLDGSPAEGEQAATACEDMCDGILALDFALTFAGAPPAARKFVISIVGLLGAGDDPLKCYDALLADHFKCDERTLRRWRSDHTEWSKAKKFSLLVITPGEYDRERKRYEKSAYYLNEGVADYINTVVSEASASELYARDRRKAIELAAEEHYHLIPDAPPRDRKKKPYRARGVKAEHPFVAALHNMEKGEEEFERLTPEEKAEYLKTRQGKALVEVRDKAAKILLHCFQVAEDEDIG